MKIALFDVAFLLAVMKLMFNQADFVITINLQLV